MARDHERTNLDIWGDDDWMDLTPAAQHLYFVLKTDPDLSYCGSGEWHPGRIAARARNWAVADIEHAAAELAASAGIFVIIDTVTEEYLLRSWIKHDGLWRIPNMAVSMANARAALASRTLRGVVVHEVKKLRAANKTLGSWERDAVANMLSQKAIDPNKVDPFTPPPTGGLTPDVTPRLTPGLTLSGGVGVNPPPNPPPTPAPAPLAPTPLGGYVSTEGDEGDREPPSPHCINHPGGTERPCRACGDARARHDAAVKQIEDDELRRRRELRLNCQICGGTNLIEVGPNRVERCFHQESRHA